MATSTFYSPTQDEILADYLRDIGLEIPGAVTTDGSDYQRTGTVLAMTLLPIYRNGEVLAREALPDEAISDKGLIRWSRVASVPKQGAAFADGTATVVASIATTIPDGTFLKRTSTGVIYKTVGDTPVSATPATAFLVATTAGAAGDVDPGELLDFVSTPPGVNPQATVISISGGDDAWSNVRWATEILRALRARAGGGNVPQIYQLGLAVPGVEQIFVFPALRGTGTLDVVVVTSAASGSRAAGKSLLAKVSAALRFGARAIGGDFVFGIPCDVFENTSIAPAVEQPVDLAIGLEASLVNRWASWPDSKASDATTWWTVAAASSLTHFTVYKVGGWSSTPPTTGKYIALYFPSVGFVRGLITSASASAPDSYDLIVTWSTTPTESTPPLGTVVAPWNANLPKLAGPKPTGSNALSGAIPTYFAALGPGEMTPLTADDVTRRCRWPRQSDTNPITGEIEWPTDVGGRLVARIYDATDAKSVTAPSVSVSTPSVPAGAYIGTPPSILVPGKIVVLPP